MVEKFKKSYFPCVTNVTKILNVYYNLVNMLDNNKKKNKILV